MVAHLGRFAGCCCCGSAACVHSIGVACATTPAPILEQQPNNSTAHSSCHGEKLVLLLSLIAFYLFMQAFKFRLALPGAVVCLYCPYVDIELCAQSVRTVLSIT